ncbi:uncharacterized protein LOC128665228 [Bombina bombina]|uniref:uncharacterized protein LOC128636290 n=1 Tax=Bombina bombina TaxID=8345 RepID=UPI00235ADB6B|nr:uncharacterized protein LOC128636290 [Bombina bombina]XP_053545640.1 uncharacterized protein LOC128636674 [Bombina bombina]XP_053550218.1 uncharacterized protein LOC128641716 [Bombina bombina]XP_053552371.1 uncharacterized protein LOC128643553 [Bombina bombina]XP_053556107.1 uncharacterized protein LOC128647349 [Bombina bombina]XP_053556168.1 uncharacterized protein LOC128647405 [Bombina bombina]XP_053561567.1 uncharacterized protein LOC128652661 [Bombina bombina]XP_053568177.1 uncharacte
MKLCKEKRSARGTGGGPGYTADLMEYEKKVLNLMGPEVVEGIEVQGDTDDYAGSPPTQSDAHALTEIAACSSVLQEVEENHNEQNIEGEETLLLFEDDSENVEYVLNLQPIQETSPVHSSSTNVEVPEEEIGDVHEDIQQEAQAPTEEAISVNLVNILQLATNFQNEQRAFFQQMSDLQSERLEIDRQSLLARQETNRLLALLVNILQTRIENH